VAPDSCIDSCIDSCMGTECRLPPQISNDNAEKPAKEYAEAYGMSLFGGG